MTASISNIFVNLKGFFTKISKRGRILLFSIAGSVVLLAVFFTLFLRSSHSGYTVLYSDISAAESAQVYQELLELGAKPAISSSGEIMVPSNEYDIWLLQLAAKGYPQTALTYDVFSSHTGLTATESEKKQWLLYQLQDRIQATLMKINGIKNATVTITVPDNSGSVWVNAESEKRATAGVLLTLGNNVTLGAEQVAAIKNLVASSVPNMVPTDVTVVNAGTGLELQGKKVNNGITNTENLLYEQTVQRQLEDNIVRLLSPRYGTDGVVAVAKVTLDYDRMMTERMELIGKPDGSGYTTSDEGEYGVNGEVPAGGIVGEENNTDIPEYGYTLPTDEEGMTLYWWSRNYDYGYIKTQVEKGNAKLDHATVSVMVNEENLTQALRNELTSLISNAVDIAQESIYVSSFTIPVVEEPVVTPEPDSLWDMISGWIYIAAGGLVFLLAIGISLLLVIKRNRRLKMANALKAEEELNQQSEIEEYKKHLEELAKEGLDLKDEAVMRDVRNFARENPEITANLIRSWLKEGD